MSIYIGKKCVDWINTVLSSTPTEDNPYIQDGLLAMFDGEWNYGVNNHLSSNDARCWLDITNNKRYSIQNSNKSIIYDKYVEFSGNEGYELIDRLGNPLQITIEMVFNAYELTYLGGVFSCAESGGVGLLTKSSDGSADTPSWMGIGLPAGGYIYHYFKIPINTFEIILVTKSDTNFRVIENGIELCNKSCSAGIRYNTSYPFCIGKDPGSSEGYFKGRIYSIRVYDRPLTDNELLINRNLDNERFC